MPIVFQTNKVIFFSDTLRSLVVNDETIEANGEPHYINGGVHSAIAVDEDENTWIFTVPTWEHVILTKSQYVHIEGPRIYTESGATYVCLIVCNSTGALAYLTRQISSKAQPAHISLTDKEQEDSKNT